MNRHFYFLGHVLEETRVFKFETVLTFIMVSVGNNVLFLLHANITRYFYFLVTKGNLTLLFFTRE